MPRCAARKKAPFYESLLQRAEALLTRATDVLHGERAPATLAALTQLQHTLINIVVGALCPGSPIRSDSRFSVFRVVDFSQRLLPCAEGTLRLDRMSVACMWLVRPWRVVGAHEFL